MISLTTGLTREFSCVFFNNIGARNSFQEYESKMLRTWFWPLKRIRNTKMQQRYYKELRSSIDLTRLILQDKELNILFLACKRIIDVCVASENFDSNEPELKAPARKNISFELPPDIDESTKVNLDIEAVKAIMIEENSDGVFSSENYGYHDLVHEEGRSDFLADLLGKVKKNLIQLFNALCLFESGGQNLVDIFSNPMEENLFVTFKVKHFIRKSCLF